MVATPTTFTKAEQVGKRVVRRLNLPKSPPSSGPWQPPHMETVGVQIVVAHAGFSGKGGNVFGTIDITDPRKPVWSAQNCSINPLPSVPIWVSQFFQRAYFYCNPTGQQPAVLATDVLNPKVRTNGTYTLTFGNNINIVAGIGLGVDNQLLGQVQALLVFQSATNIWNISGDFAGNPLTNSIPPISQNSLNVATGTLAGNSLVSTPLGVMFVAPDGLRKVDAHSQVSPPIGYSGSGVSQPFANALVPSRVCAACNATSVRITTQDSFVTTTPTEEWVYDLVRDSWHGPHSFPSSLITSYGTSFIMAPVGVDGIWKSDLNPNFSSVYKENGVPMTCIYQTAMVPVRKDFRQQSLIESVFYQGHPAGPVTFTVSALDLDYVSLDTTTVTFNDVGQQNLSPATIPWNGPITFDHMALLIKVPAAPNIILGPSTLLIQPTGYTATGPSAPIQVISIVKLIIGTQYIIPDDWTNINTIEILGAGGPGGVGGASGAGGGGSAAYARLTNFVSTAGTIIPIQVGVSGGTTGPGTAPTANSWFKNGSTLVAAGAAAGASAAAGGAGGAAGTEANSVGNVIRGGSPGGAGVPEGGSGGGAGAPGVLHPGIVGSDGSGMVGGPGGQGDSPLGGDGGLGGSPGTPGVDGTETPASGGGGAGGNKGFAGGAAGVQGAGGGGSGVVAGPGGGGTGGIILIKYVVKPPAGGGSGGSKRTYKIEAIGAGGDAARQADVAASGAGGAYAKVSSVQLTIGQALSYQVGIHGGAVGPGTGVPTNTWLMDLNGSIIIQAAGGGTWDGVTNPKGGTVANSTGTTVHKGGDGQPVTFSSPGLGGGGAGGPNGDGQDPQPGPFADNINGGDGGGGAPGGKGGIGAVYGSGSAGHVGGDGTDISSGPDEGSGGGGGGGDSVIVSSGGNGGKWGGGAGVGGGGTSGNGIGANGVIVLTRLDNMMVTVLTDGSSFTP